MIEVNPYYFRANCWQNSVKMKSIIFTRAIRIRAWALAALTSEAQPTILNRPINETNTSKKPGGKKRFIQYSQLGKGTKRSSPPQVCLLS